MAALSAWSAERRVEEEVATRTRERWLRQQAMESATWAAALAELVESRSELAVSTRCHELRGRIVAAGADLVILAERRGSSLVALDHVVALRVGPTGAPPNAGWSAGDRERAGAATTSLRLVDALAALAGERLPVRLGLAGGDDLTGELATVGVDVLTLGPPVVVVPLVAVEVCTPLSA